jgi:putative copper export protein
MTWDGPALVYAAARWLYYSALFLVVGAGVARWAVIPMSPAGSAPVGRIIRTARLASVTLALAVVARLYLQSRAMIDPGEPVTPDLVKAVLASTWGKGWLAQGSAALVVLVGWRSMRLGESATVRGLVMIGSLGLVMASPLTGHAVGLPATGRLGYPLMVAHVGAGAAWLGTLGVLVLAVIGRPGGPDLGQTIGRFSALALPAGGAAIAAGGLVAWRYLGGLDPLITTPYGRTLLIKLGLLAGVAGTGAYNWRVVLPRLKRGEDAPVRSSATFEVIVGLTLLAVTSVLVSLAAPGEHSE